MLPLADSTTLSCCQTPDVSQRPIDSNLCPPVARTMTPQSTLTLRRQRSDNTQLLILGAAILPTETTEATPRVRRRHCAPGPDPRATASPRHSCARFCLLDAPQSIPLTLGERLSPTIATTYAHVLAEVGFLRLAQLRAIVPTQLELERSKDHAIGLMKKRGVWEHPSTFAQSMKRNHENGQQSVRGGHSG